VYLFGMLRIITDDRVSEPSMIFAASIPKFTSLTAWNRRRRVGATRTSEMYSGAEGVNTGAAAKELVIASERMLLSPEPVVGHVLAKLTELEERTDRWQVIRAEAAERSAVADAFAPPPTSTLTRAHHIDRYRTAQ
jgi:hypothetical protein